MKQMTREQFLEYGKGLKDRPCSSVEEAKTATQKLRNLLEKFGFEYSRAFSYNGENTSWFYRLETNAETKEYIEVQVGYLYEYKSVPTRKKGRYGSYKSTKSVRTDKTKMLFRVSKGAPCAYKEGQIYDRGGYSAMYTRHGWYTGD